MSIERAMDILRKYPLCNHCLGRLFARLGTGLDNEERGRAIKDYLLMRIHERILNEGLSDELLNDVKALAVSGHEPSIKFLSNMGINVSPARCYVCGDTIFNRLNEWVNNIVNSLRSLGIEFRSFRLGSRVPLDIQNRELSITTEFNISSAESIKREINRELGKRVSAMLGVSFNREEPDVEVVIDVNTGSVEVQIMPIYISARYRKVHRLINEEGQVKWPIDRVIQAYNAQDVVIHTGGEDPMGVRVLGNGRPVILQVVKPSKRPDVNDVYALLKDSGYDIVLDNLSRVRASAVVKMKARVRDYVITYRVLAITDNSVTNENIKSLHDYFRNRQVVQVFRRGRRIRRRISMVYELDGRVIRDRLVEFLIRCQGNLYIRGFVHGGLGDVEPSIAGTLGFSVRPVEIDILNISD
ncbi:tRNA pseudouridine(55) synthase [Vulcanisaeta distributa]|uniref:tRNA pseudouridine synthase Pus10 n=1 Tax=Vulcanisaeta distributa (strain DSM 14429 / JCM 11212 / NBRC 100878 / IC-017) TaxID=572478 RepID=PUS10_VULDI|nr:tRNA pseudouridine(54/55) synthase Pus10 [Vulcanisaeta distributa]E1QUT8.1 RecName: Full=tRNA pseudouridine synthase Pus10; AltName: Full=tRNA pseudouridine 54/55 synthase; Short=Psi54/55 synthase [Vulcanisaeta distributa DSM 14429]ADN49941.1 THUMP domain protein [Vulcanisaeta distributa DSM 14429]